ncbi:hypothetical protein WR25_11215 [Diploscapter pachys]|uniref:Uncharacterized protein n=1 Tax=Diploscapter pachys TaxID=2018661 RepID=A0A2A2LU13_9BILA|nr:hypothetical protein WR25_11215 [Diploscapter pachys]
MTVMDMLYFRFKFYGDDYPIAYTQMAFYRPLAFMLNPVFVIAALLLTLPESRMCLPKLCGQNDEVFGEVGLSSKAQVVNASVKSSTPPPSNPVKSSPPPSKSENALNPRNSPRLSPIHAAKVSPLTSSVVATPRAPPRSDEENDAPRQPHLRQFNMNLDETETIIANAPAMPTTISPQSSPPRISPPTVIVNSGVNSTPNTARVADEGENREGKPTPARFHIRLEPISRPATRQRRDVEPVKAGNLGSLNPMLYPGATSSDTNKTVIRGELHRLDPMIYPGAAKEIPILETSSPRSERGSSPALSSPPATTVASPVPPAMDSTVSVPHVK